MNSVWTESIAQQEAPEVGSLALCCPLAVGGVPSRGQWQATVLMVSDYGSHLSSVSPHISTSARPLLFNVQRGPHAAQKLSGSRKQNQRTAVSFYMNNTGGKTDDRKCKINVPWLLVDTWGRLTWSAGWERVKVRRCLCSKHTSACSSTAHLRSICR